MFIDKYLSSNKLKLFYELYDNDYIDSIDKDNFIEIYNIFKKYNFYYMEDIIYKYLEIFTMDSDKVERGIINLKNILGDNYVYIIGEDLRLLKKII